MMMMMDTSGCVWRENAEISILVAWCGVHQVCVCVCSMWKYLSHFTHSIPKSSPPHLHLHHISHSLLWLAKRVPMFNLWSRPIKKSFHGKLHFFVLSLPFVAVFNLSMGTMKTKIKYKKTKFGEKYGNYIDLETILTKWGLRSLTIRSV